MLRLFNTASGRKEIFRPFEGKLVRIYTCGPTVYNYAHIGNLSTYLSGDFLKRYLRWRGYQVRDVMNFTDVDDKTIRASREKKTPLSDYTAVFGQSVLDDLQTLNIIRPEIICPATQHIPDMVRLVQTLLDKGYAYRSADGSIYFQISKFKDYGKFANLSRRQMKTNASGRINSDEYTKKSVSDFVLWKAWTPDDGDVFWDSPLGRGRPGWHIECSAMSMKYLGPSFDIHTGAIDLIFPHHQNEIAQSEAATGQQFVKYWFHRGFLKINSEKMSKSLGNVYLLREILDHVSDPMAFRYLILTAHYRQPLNFTFEHLSAAASSLNRIRNFLTRLADCRSKPESLTAIKNLLKTSKKEVITALNDDLNAPQAIASLFGLINAVNKLIDQNQIGDKGRSLILGYLHDIDQVWGFIFSSPPASTSSSEIDSLIQERQRLRAAKNWAAADAIKAKLISLGVTIHDESTGN